MKTILLLIIASLSFSSYATSRAVYAVEMDPNSRLVCTNYKQLWIKKEVWRDDYGIHFKDPEAAYQLFGTVAGDNSLKFVFQKFVTNKTLAEATAVTSDELFYDNSTGFSLQLLADTVTERGNMDAVLTVDGEEYELHCYNPRNLGI